MNKYSGENISKMTEKELVNAINSGFVEPCDLTFLAEALGNISKNDNLVCDTLMPLLSHPEAVVREGALYGLSGHLTENAKDLVMEVALNDVSHGVRKVAGDVLLEE
jgi:hypothetical protein